MRKNEKILSISDFTNNALRNMITPFGLEFKKNETSVGDTTGKVYGVHRYAQKFDIAWLSKIMNIPHSIVVAAFTPVDSGELISTLSRNVVRPKEVL